MPPTSRSCSALLILATGCLALVTVALPPGALTPSTAAPAAATHSSPEQAIARAARGTVQVLRDETTDRVEFVTASGSGADLAPAADGSARQVSMAWLADHADVFGVPVEQLVLDRVERTALGSTATVTQHLAGVPVWGAALKVNVDRSGALTSVNGHVVPDLAMSTSPARTAEAAAALAVTAVRTDPPRDVAGRAAPTSELAASSDLVVYETGSTMGAPGQSHLAWEVRVSSASVSERVILDDATGKMLNRWTDTDALGPDRVLERYADDAGTPNDLTDDPYGPLWSEGAPTAALSTAQQDLLSTTSEAYWFFHHTFGRDSYDNAGARLVLRAEQQSECPNAAWMGGYVTVCPGLETDDVVAHEWGHAFTEYTSGLVYQWQPGALNESYSDVWGETIDLINQRRDIGENLARRSIGDTTGDRWKLGESTSVFGGALRDMWNPQCTGDPATVSDAEYYCQDGDNGGVHFNSGVPNRAYSLLVDGGTSNGQQVGALGLDKAAHLWWRVGQSYLTPTSDFQDFAASLTTACTAMVGQDLVPLSVTAAGPAGVSAPITTADCGQVERAIRATGLRTDAVERCGAARAFDTGAPASCGSAFTTTSLLVQGFEQGLAGWSTSRATTVSPGPATWRVVSKVPNNAGAAAFAAEVNDSTTCGGSSGISRAGRTSLTSPIVRMPATVPTGSTAHLRFRHLMALEQGYDGANVKYQVNGGAWRTFPASAWRSNGPQDRIGEQVPGSGTSDNPMYGQVAWSRLQAQTTNTGWGTSVVNLSAVGLKAADAMRFRFDLGTDTCGGWDGWYLDDVRVDLCRPRGKVAATLGASLSPTRPDRGRAFVVRTVVTARTAVAGGVTGTVTARVDGRPLRTVRVRTGSRRGVALLQVTRAQSQRLSRGRHVLVVRYSGNQRVTATTRRLVFRVR